MSDVRVAPIHDADIHIAAVSTNGSGGRQAARDQSHPQQRERTGAEELAVALHEHGRGRLRAHLVTDAAGVPLIHIVDHDRNETVAVVTPEELRVLAEQTGLPSGLLVEASS